MARGRPSPPPRSEALRETIAATRIDAPARNNPSLAALFAAADSDEQLKAWWYSQQVTADRLGMSDHSWVHIRVVLNIALRLLRILCRRGVATAMESEHGMSAKDAEVVVAAAVLLHDSGMSVHRKDHEDYSLFLAADKLPALLAGVYDEPERSVVVTEALHAIIGHRKGGEPLTLEAGVVRVADALDMEHGRSRVPFEARRPNIHSLSAAAIEDVRIEAGKQRAIRIEIDMNNSSGLFQVDELLAAKLRGSGIEDHVEVIARIEAEHEKRLVPVFRI
jgi:hypothetical protein